MLFIFPLKNHQIFCKNNRQVFRKIKGNFPLVFVFFFKNAKIISSPTQKIKRIISVFYRNILGNFPNADFDKNTANNTFLSFETPMNNTISFVFKKRQLSRYFPQKPLTNFPNEQYQKILPKKCY